MACAHSRRGLGLIEVLVAIGIMIVLVAILVPLLGSVFRRVELAICGSNLKGIATALRTYADNKRRYLTDPKLGYRDRPPNFIAARGVFDYDLRDLLRPYGSIDLFVCPLVESINLSKEANSQLTTVASTYDYFAGWQYRVPGRNEVGMFRPGDRFSWDGHKFSVLAADRNFIGSGEINKSVRAETTHQDDGETLTAFRRQNEGMLTKSSWVSVYGKDRGLLTQNVVFDDASVQLYRDLTMDDQRVIGIPDVYDDNAVEGSLKFPPMNPGEGGRLYLPPAN